jgi:hypothetical protein
MDEQPATTTPKDEKHSINWGALILWPFVVLIIYVLSSGPVSVIMDKRTSSRSNQLVRRFYKPLSWAYNKTPLHKPLGMYAHLWEPKFFDKNGNEIY